MCFSSIFSLDNSCHLLVIYRKSGTLLSVTAPQFPLLPPADGFLPWILRLPWPSPVLVILHCVHALWVARPLELWEKRWGCDTDGPVFEIIIVACAGIWWKPKYVLRQVHLLWGKGASEEITQIQDPLRSGGKWRRSISSLSDQLKLGNKC